MPNKHQPYVGDSAFAHKGGVHIHAVLKNAATYEHVDPELVGNRQRMLVSDYAGRSGLLEKIEAYGITLPKDIRNCTSYSRRLKNGRAKAINLKGRKARSSY